MVRIGKTLITPHQRLHISRDDGRTWQPLDNGNWNALSLPFIVGPKGRIARLNPSAIRSSPNRNSLAITIGNCILRRIQASSR